MTATSRNASRSRMFSPSSRSIRFQCTFHIPSGATRISRGRMLPSSVRASISSRTGLLSDLAVGKDVRYAFGGVDGVDWRKVAFWTPGFPECFVCDHPRWRVEGAGELASQRGNSNLTVCKYTPSGQSIGGQAGCYSLDLVSAWIQRYIIGISLVFMTAFLPLFYQGTFLISALSCRHLITVYSPRSFHHHLCKLM